MLTEFEVKKYMNGLSLNAKKGNPYHDENGRFTNGPSGAYGKYATSPTSGDVEMCFGSMKRSDGSYRIGYSKDQAQALVKTMAALGSLKSATSNSDLDTDCIKYAREVVRDACNFSSRSMKTNSYVVERSLGQIEKAAKAKGPMQQQAKDIQKVVKSAINTTNYIFENAAGRVDKTDSFRPIILKKQDLIED